jgi:hypothetical protein
VFAIKPAIAFKFCHCFLPSSEGITGTFLSVSLVRLQGLNLPVHLLDLRGYRTFSWWCPQVETKRSLGSE